jgi:tetratricopeptide (TPR) repeat protein
MTERMSARNKITCRSTRERVAALCTRSIVLLSLVAAVMSCSNGFAQTSAAHRRPDRELPWANTDPEYQRHPNIDDELDRGSGQQITARQPQPVSGIVTLHELSHQVPGKAAKECERGYNAVNKGDLETAIKYFKKAIAIDPEFFAAFNALGATYLRLSQIDSAIEQFNRAIAVDPHAAVPYSNLAIAYLGHDQYGDAERTARRALDLDRASTHGRLVLGVSLVLQKKFTAEAEQSLRKAAFDFPHANFWLAIGLYLRGDIATAKDHLKMYLASGEKAGMDKAKALMQELDLVAQSKQ